MVKGPESEVLIKKCLYSKTCVNLNYNSDVWKEHSVMRVDINALDFPRNH